MSKCTVHQVILCTLVLRSIIGQVAVRADEELNPDSLAKEDCSQDGEFGHLKLLQKRSMKQTAASKAEESSQPGRTSEIEPKKPCLCIFDTDRTLTAIQHYEYEPPFNKVSFPKEGPEKVDASCPGAVDQPLSKDTAYPLDWNGPNLTMRISELSARFEHSFCGKHCYKGILSVGTIGGQHLEKLDVKGYFRMVNELEFILQKGPDEHKLPCSRRHKWAPRGRECSINALDTLVTKPEELKPFIINIGAACYQKDPSLGKFSGACKVDYVQNITAYYKAVHDVTIPDEDVYFFDDACVNVAGFKDSKYRARQISCSSRQCWQEPKDGSFSPDNNLGVCGATVEEVNSLLTGPRHYMCTVDGEGKCDAAFGCL